MHHLIFLVFAYLCCLFLSQSRELCWVPPPWQYALAQDDWVQVLKLAVSFFSSYLYMSGQCRHSYDVFVGQNMPVETVPLASLCVSSIPVDCYYFVSPQSGHVVTGRVGTTLLSGLSYSLMLRHCKTLVGMEIASPSRPTHFFTGRPEHVFLPMPLALQCHSLAAR